MLNTFRKLINIWGGANASASEKPNDVSIKTAPSQTTFNSGAPPTQYAKKVLRTPSPPIAPNSALTGYFFSRVMATGASHINNIPPPQVPLFGVTATTRTGQGISNPFIKSDDIDMPDANFQSPPTPPTPSATPPSGDDAQHQPNESSQPHGRDTAAGDGAHESSDAVPSTSVDPNRRPQLVPVRQQDRQQRPTTPQPKKNWVDDIVIEEDTPENNLPIGYLGTFRSWRHVIPEYPGMLPCSHNTKHLLVCGRWVSSSEPCGSNCRRQNHAKKPFNCPTCQDIIREVLTGSILPAAELMRLRKLKDKENSIVYVSCCVEQVVRAVPQIKTGVTEAVAGILLKDYGRKCEPAENPDPEGLETIEWIVRDMQERTERKQREKFARENSPNTHEKRKSYEDAMNLSVNAGYFTNDCSTAQSKQLRDGSSTGEDEKQNVLSANSKRQKTKLETHCEPTTRENRGTKRSSPSSSSSDDNISPFAFVPNNKPILTPIKKVYTSPSSTFGEASFLSPPASVVGAIMRKRRNDVDLDNEGDVQMEGGFKRCRVNGWRASQEEVNTKIPGFAGFAAVWDEDKDDS